MIIFIKNFTNEQVQPMKIVLQEDLRSPPRKCVDLSIPQMVPGTLPWLELLELFTCFCRLPTYFSMIL